MNAIMSCNKKMDPRSAKRTDFRNWFCSRPSSTRKTARPRVHCGRWPRLRLWRDERGGREGACWSLNACLRVEDLRLRASLAGPACRCRNRPPIPPNRPTFSTRPTPRRGPGVMLSHASLKSSLPWRTIAKTPTAASSSVPCSPSTAGKCAGPQLGTRVEPAPDQPLSAPAIASPHAGRVRHRDGDDWSWNDRKLGDRWRSRSISSRMKSEGIAWAGLSVRTVLSNGARELVGTEGEVVVKGRQLVLGCFKHPQVTAQAIDKDGSLHTGDVGFFDEKKRVTWLGRYADMCKCSGFDLASMEVDAFLDRHPSAAEVAALGRRGCGQWRSRSAFIVPNQDLPSITSISARSAPGKSHPARIRGRIFFRDELPKPASATCSCESSS